MFKRKGTDNPKIPKLPSVALPSSYPDPRMLSSSKLFNRFRSSNSALPLDRPASTTHQVALPDPMARNRPRGISNATDETVDDDEDDEEDGYIDPRRHSRRDSMLPGNPTEYNLPRPSQVGNATAWLRMKEEADAEFERQRLEGEKELARRGIKGGECRKSKAQLEQEKEWEEELDQQLALKREAQRHPNARITLVKSKAAIEEEQEREAEERERERYWREIDEAKEAAKLKANPPPLKSCLKNSQGRLNSATPSPPSNTANYNHPPAAYAANPQHDLRRSSTNYYSDTEQYRPAYRSRSNTYHATTKTQPQPPPPVRADSYPPDPRFNPQPNMEWAYPPHLMERHKRSMTNPQFNPFLAQMQFAQMQIESARKVQQQEWEQQQQQRQITPPGQQLTPPGQPSRYKKAYVKPDGQKPSSILKPPPPPEPEYKPPTPPPNMIKHFPTHEEIVLSWPLVAPEHRPRDMPPLPGCGVIFFDVAFDPRLPEFEIQVLRYGDRARSPLTRAEQTAWVCPSAWCGEIFIYSDLIPQWPIIIQQRKNIRVVDVFRAIYDTLAVPLTRTELAKVGERERVRVERWFVQRCQDSPGLPPVTAGKGWCRVDLLRGRRIFKGLVPVQGPGIPKNAWRLDFDKIGGEDR